jgi:hypothetical protein
MKRCPQCNRVETDEALKFCRIDGAPLLGDPSAVNREAGTIQLGSTVSGETETSSGANLNRVTAPTTTLPGQSLPVNTSRVSKSNRKRTAVAIVVILTVVGAITVAVNFYRSRARPGAVIQSIAVMPFVNGSGDANVEYLSDGLTDSIIFRFSQLPNVKVSPTSSVMRFKGSAKDVAEIAKELDVDAVLTAG